MKYTKIYCGSNNETKELELEKITDVMVRWQDNYTIILANGCYNSGQEKTAIIEIYGITTLELYLN